MDGGMSRRQVRRLEEAVADPLVLINAFEVSRRDYAERFIAAWEKTRDYLSAQPGYVDTALHQAVTPHADFQFVNIGRWQTVEDFQAATQSPCFRESAAGLAGTGRIRTLLAGRPRGDWTRGATSV
jgi:heme-degrading monooxygenase HmoA